MNLPLEDAVWGKHVPLLNIGVTRGGDLVGIAEGVAAPERFRVEVETTRYRCTLHGLLGAYGQPECSGITLHMLDGSALDWRVLQRVPLDAWLKQGFTLTLRVWSDEMQRWIDPGAMSPSEWRDATLERLQRSAVERSAARRPLTRDFLSEVARIWKSAKAAGLPPVKALQEAFPGSSTSTINKWIARARDPALDLEMPPAKYTKKQPASPTRPQPKKGATDG